MCIIKLPVSSPYISLRGMINSAQRTKVKNKVYFLLKEQKPQKDMGFSRSWWWEEGN